MKDVKPNKDIFLNSKIQNRQKDIILMMKYYFTSTNLLSHVTWQMTS